MLAIALVAYFGALHLLIVEHVAARLTLAMVLLPWFVAAWSRRGWRVLGTCALIALGGSLFVQADALAWRVDVLLLVENVVFLLALSALFASTLRPGRVALISMLARQLRGGALPEAAVRYTRRVTAAWAVFFVACACVSVVLHAWAPLSWWSLFVNVLIWPAIAAMFAIEYAVRLRVLPQIEHVSLMAGLRAYAEHGKASEDD